MKACKPCKGLVAAFGRSLNRVTKANGAASLKLPVVKMETGLLGWGSKAETIAYATTREESGLLSRFEV